MGPVPVHTSVRQHSRFHKHTPYFTMASEDQLREAFNMIDTDGSGVISRKEVVNLFAMLSEKHNQNWDETTIKAYAANFMAEGDESGDGKITFEEFKAGYESKCK